MKWLSIPTDPMISNVLAVVMLQADHEEDNSLVITLGASLRFHKAPAAAITLNSKKLPSPHDLELNPRAVALTAKFDGWRTFSSAAVVIVLSKLTTFTTHK